MSDESTGNPISDGIGHAARQAAEVAAVLAVGAQAALRGRERQLQTQTATERGQLGAEHAAARLTWLDPGLGSASVSETAQVWAAAQRWISRDPTAAEGARRAEARLDELVPELMDRYRELVAEGNEPHPAMSAAAGTRLRDADAAWAQASAERAAAAAGYATPDVAGTRLDEHHQGVTIGGVHADEADAAATRAAALAAVAYPQPISSALADRTSPPPPGWSAATSRRQMNRGRGR